MTLFALMMSNSSAALSSWSMYLMLLTVVPLSLMLAPQEIRRDKRTVVAVLVLAMVAISAPAAYAFPLFYCNRPDWFLFVECWFAS